MLFRCCYLFHYFIVTFIVIVNFGRGQNELKQDGPGQKFNLKCPEGSYVSHVLSTFSDSGDDHRIYKVRCSPLKIKGATKCKPGSESDYLKDFSIGCSGNEYLAGIESTDFKNQDRKFRATCCTTENMAVASSSCSDLSTRGTTGFNAAAPKDQVFQKFDSKYVLSKQNGKFMADRSFVLSTCSTTEDSSSAKSSEPSGGSQPVAKNPPEPPPKSASLSSSSSSGNRNGQSANLPEKKSVVGSATSSDDKKSNSKNSNPPPSPAPQKSTSNSNANPPAPPPPNPPPSKSSPSKSKSNSSPNSGSSVQLKERRKTSDSSSNNFPSNSNPAPPPPPPPPPKSQNSGAGSSGNTNAVAARKIASANQKGKGGGSGGGGANGGWAAPSSSGGGDGDYLPETVAFQSFDTKCPKGSAIRNMKIKRVEQGSKRDAIFALKCDKLPDYIDSNDIEDQVIGYTAKKDGSVQSPCDVSLGQFMCGIRGEYEDNRGVEAHCCRVKDTFPSFTQNPVTVVATQEGGVLKSDVSKGEFVGNLDQLPDGTFVGQMVVFGKLYVVKGTNVQTDDGCRCKCNCQCPNKQKQTRSERSIINENPIHVFGEINKLRHKRQECSGECECKCVIQNC